MVLKYIATTDIHWRTNENPVADEKNGILEDRKKLKPAHGGKYNAVLWKAGEEVDPSVGVDLAVNSKELVEVVTEEEASAIVEKVKKRVKSKKASHGYIPE